MLVFRTMFLSTKETSVNEKAKTDLTRRDFLVASGAGALALGAAEASGKEEAPLPRKTLGRTGVKVPVLGLGTAPIGFRKEKEAIEFYNRCIDRGLTYLDTAPELGGYGKAQAYLGQTVQKYGRTTGFQSGVVAGLAVAVDVCYLPFLNFCLQEARFVNQISITPGTFSGPGDSGSLIVSQDGNQPVALLFAGGDGLTIGNPIDVVLQRFGPRGANGKPPVWVRSCSTVTTSLPFEPNSGT